MKANMLKVEPRSIYGQPGHRDAQAAADSINRTLSDSGECVFINADRLGERTAERAMQRELNSCAPEILADLVVVAVSADVEDD